MPSTAGVNNMLSVPVAGKPNTNGQYSLGTASPYEWAGRIPATAGSTDSSPTTHSNLRFYAPAAWSTKRLNAVEVPSNF